MADTLDSLVGKRFASGEYSLTFFSVHRPSNGYVYVDTLHVGWRCPSQEDPTRTSAEVRFRDGWVELEYEANDYGRETYLIVMPNRDGTKLDIIFDKQNGMAGRSLYLVACGQ